MQKPVIAMAVLLIACGKAPPKTPDTTVVEQVESVPPAIDTTVPTILGVAANRAPGAAGWCMLSSHRDVWVGRPVRVIFTTARKILDTKVGDAIPGCPGPEATPGAKAYELTFQHEPPLEGFPAIVLRNDVWGNINKDMSAEFDLDGDRVMDTITICTTGSVARFRMVYAGEVPRRPWRHEMPYAGGEEPRCADAVAAPVDPNAPTMLFWWTTMPATYQPPYGEMWTALRSSDEGANLLRTPVVPMIAQGGCRNGSADGKRLIAAAAPEGYTALFLHVPGLAEGRVDKADMQDFGGLMTSDSVVITLKGRHVTVRREKIGSSGFRVTAEAGGSVYTLFETPTSDLGRVSVNWAGDLDRDGEIDFLLLAHQRNWQSGLQLHLSKQRTSLAWPAAATYVERTC